MDENNKKPKDVFGLTPMQFEVVKPTNGLVINNDAPSEAPSGTNMVDTDYDFSRNQMRDAISITMAALAEAAMAASQSGDANSFVAVAQIAKTATDASEKLLKLSEIQQKIKGAPEVKDETPTYQQNIFMTTDEMLEKMIAAKKKSLE